MHAYTNVYTDEKIKHLMVFRNLTNQSKSMDATTEHESTSIYW